MTDGTTEQSTGPVASIQDAVEVLTRGPQARGVHEGDTAATLVELYERIERTYRAAAMAGRVSAQASATTNFS